ncbi:hypothetical protein E2C01_095290 [Portunus trituberculatus]|uniref:Uncharacterized protein n=1 Tax=Portunus trituberculatus TaxID=210409 RepID=A0A5B7K3U7_PORTR|nr:hypothetical protein [Portunus trituberculatus]
MTSRFSCVVGDDLFLIHNTHQKKKQPWREGSVIPSPAPPQSPPPPPPPVGNRWMSGWEALDGLVEGQRGTATTSRRGAHPFTPFTERLHPYFPSLLCWYCATEEHG